ncbi:MAG: ArdC-like ssDNA-binding domain-containing protein [Planctomycetaceae bacterium]
MNRDDLYTRVTNRIVSQLEAGTKPWAQPWKAEHTAGRISRPLRANGEAYNGINILTLWMQPKPLAIVAQAG